MLLECLGLLVDILAHLFDLLHRCDTPETYTSFDRDYGDTPGYTDQ